MTQNSKIVVSEVQTAGEWKWPSEKLHSYSELLNFIHDAPIKLAKSLLFERCPVHTVPHTNYLIDRNRNYYYYLCSWQIARHFLCINTSVYIDKGKELNVNTIASMQIGIAIYLLWNSSSISFSHCNRSYSLSHVLNTNRRTTNETIQQVNRRQWDDGSILLFVFFYLLIVSLLCGFRFVSVRSKFMCFSIWVLKAIVDILFFFKSLHTTKDSNRTLPRVYIFGDFLIHRWVHERRARARTHAGRWRTLNEIKLTEYRKMKQMKI